MTDPKDCYEIRENTYYSFDVYDIRLAGKRWLACFRLFKDAAEWTAARLPQVSPEARQDG